MDKDQKEVIERVLYPILRASVRQQLYLPSLSIMPGQDANGSACLNITDGKKLMSVPILNTKMENVSLLVDIFELKKYILNEKEN